MSITKLNRDQLAICSLILAMCVSMNLYFTWKFPQSLINFTCAIVLFFYLLKVKIPRNSVFLLVLLIVNFAYNYTHNTASFSFLSLLNILSITTISMFMVFSDIRFKIRILRFFELFLKFICCVSLVGWFLYLAGISLPHYYSDTNDYYSHEVYYLFVVGANNVFELIPRFCGMFLEPGHIGSTCCLLLFINRFDFKDKSNYIYLLSIILSLSLAAYCLFFIGFFLHYILKGVHLIKYIISLGVLAFVFYIFGLTYNDGDNIFNEKIISRLMFVDGELAGDNRTSMLFDAYYEEWLKRGDVLNGYGRKAYGEEGSGASNILHGCASYKRFFFVNGIIGSILVLALYWSLFYRYRSRQGWVFFILFIICNMIRDYPFRLMWFYIFILGSVALSVSENDIITQKKSL